MRRPVSPRDALSFPIDALDQVQERKTGYEKFITAKKHQQALRKTMAKQVAKRVAGGRLTIGLDFGDRTVAIASWMKQAKR